MLVLYGANDFYYDITTKVIPSRIVDKILILPATDRERQNLAHYDPVPGVVKHIKIFKNEKIFNFEAGKIVCFNVDSGCEESCIDMEKIQMIKDPELKLQALHTRLKLDFGSLDDEYPEQLMSVMYIKPQDKVLELGSNIGRNTVIISSLLENSENLVSLECNPDTARQATHNLQINNFKSHIITAALSHRPLIQSGWNSFPVENGATLPPGFIQLNTITFQEIEQKFNIKFNVLIVDCEGALYYILQDDPNILNNITTIIVENDYMNVSHFQTVKNIFITNGFKLIYERELPDDYGFPPEIKQSFYNVWSKC